MRKRLALLTATALGAAGALAGGASANLWTMPHGGSGTPPADCSRADTACKAPSGGSPAQSMGVSQSAPAVHGNGVALTQAKPAANTGTNTSATAAPLR